MADPDYVILVNPGFDTPSTTVSTAPATQNSSKQTIQINSPFWKTVGQTSISTASLYKGFNLYQQYKYITAANDVIEVPVSSKKYWKPLRDENQYREYSTGDEFVQQKYLTAIVGQNSSLPSKKLSTLSFPPNTVKYWARQLYIATNRTQDLFSNTNFVGKPIYGTWENPKFNVDAQNYYVPENNPYLYNNIRIWIKIDEGLLTPSIYSAQDMVRPKSYTPVKEYWWNPKTNMMVGLDGNWSRQNLPDYRILTEVQSNPLLAVQAAYGLDIDTVENNAMSIPQFRDQIIRAIKAELINNGTPAAAAAAQAESIVSGTSGSTGTKKGGAANSAKGGKNVNNGGSSYNPRRTTVVRGNFNVGGGYVSPSYDRVSLPQMVQQYKDPRTFAPKTYRHIFRLKPNQIQYSNIGSEWTEVERAGNVPLVDWKSYKLLSVSFQFLVAPDGIGSFDDRTDTRAITESIDSELNNLRRMATSPYPVVLLGFDDILTNQLRFPYENGRGVEFVITEFNISSMFRTAYGEINRAQCDITLREIPIESVMLLNFPKPKSPPPTKPNGKKDEGSRTNAWLETSKNVTGTIEATYITGNEPVDDGTDPKVFP